MVLNIAMDGPVGAGKSSIADAVAERLGILHLDTGAMYRAIGLTALEKGVPVQDEQAVTALCQALSMTVGHAADGQHTLVDGRDVTGFIRTPEVSMAASTVAKYAGVRAAMVALQRRLAQETPMLVDGRDIGTRVLMNAPVKIFLTASADFIEGSCSNTVLEQVKARRARGETQTLETEKKGGRVLKFDGKPVTAPAQATDSARQRGRAAGQGEAGAVKPRQAVGTAGAVGARTETRETLREPVSVNPASSGATVPSAEEDVR